VAAEFKAAVKRKFHRHEGSREIGSKFSIVG
jgi:hypothetical protein